MRVVVLSCGRLGFAVAARCSRTEGVDEVLLVTAPYRTPRRSAVGKVRHVYRTQGWRGFPAVLAGKLRVRRRRPEAAPPELPPGVRHLQVADFHDPACLAALRQWQPDLGVLAGTYVLKEEVFALPRHGSINLHTGKVPDYRGAAPAFWELYNGETEVGVTIHRVVAALDAGEVLKTGCFPLEPAPAGDPMRYIERYRQEVLLPAGVELLTQVVRELANGGAVGRPQPRGGGQTYRSPTFSAVKELRRRVRERRRRMEPQS